MIDQTAIGVSLITLIGVIITQYVTYQVQKADRIAGVKDARKAEAEKWARRQPHSAELRRWRRQSVQMGRKICSV